MRYHGIEKDSMLNGEGLRIVLWISGCNHKCPGCHNPATWDKNSGNDFTEESKKELLEDLNPEWIAGLTLSGGDPMYPGNRKDVAELAKEVKEAYPEKDIWMYTGYLLEEIKGEPVLQYVDVVVDGEFQKDKADVNYPWAGSTNQKVYQKNGNVWVAQNDISGRELDWHTVHDMDNDNGQPTEWAAKLPNGEYLWIDKEAEGYALYDMHDTGASPVSVSEKLDGAKENGENYALDLLTDNSNSIIKEDM